MKFLNCKIDVSKKIFRPRPETEFWVGKALKDSGFKMKDLRILDIFAGTGCIGIAILKACPETVRRADFVDISKDAIEQIKINIKFNRVPKNKCRVYKSDMFEKLKNNRYDFIFANPPYVALERISEVQKEVLKKEPHTALFAGADGMIAIERFFDQVKKYLNPSGKIFLEFDPLQKEKIRKVFKREGFRSVFKKDQFRKYRWVEVERK
ncbi:MAG: HemK family protein methyltransferase [Patescibacteria group bacterium]